MAKLSKTKQIELRESTYHAIEVPQRCGTCKHGWFVFGGMVGSCNAIEIRERVHSKRVEQYGACDLWEAK